MKLEIGQNIKKARKEKGLTQERLAEILGVTVGAVSKWESGAAIPDIMLIISMADFFETSVDVLLGYGWHCGNLSDSLSEIRTLRNNKKFDEATKLSEKTLERYPNSFDAVFQIAIMYSMKGIERKCKKSYERALTLFDSSLKLISQNTYDNINEWSIRNHMADLYLYMGEYEKGLQLMKKNNPDNLNDSTIGYTIAKYLKDPDEALTYLSNSFITHICELQRVTYGIAIAYDQKKDYASAIGALQVFRTIIEMLRIPGRISYCDNELVQTLTLLGVYAFKLGEISDVREYLKEAKMHALDFDKAPSYNFIETRFFHGNKNMTAFDDFGMTAIQGIHDTIIDEVPEPDNMLKIWKEIYEQE